MCVATCILKIKAPFGWSENRKNGKEEENKGENDVFPYLV